MFMDPASRAARPVTWAAPVAVAVWIVASLLSPIAIARPTLEAAEDGSTDARVALLRLAAARVFPSAKTAAHQPAPSFHPTRLLVRFKHGTSPGAREAAHRTASSRRILKEYRVVEGLQLVEVAGADLETALANYRNDPNVLYAEPDYRVEFATMPNDPFFEFQWGLLNTGQTIGGQVGVVGADIRATQAWEIHTGDPDLRIAVIDTGIDYNHPDLLANIWTNPGEIPGNGIDDDGNGWIDDVHGYDTGDGDGDPLDANGHGTNVAGIIGAVGNNGRGVAGVNWRCRLVALKFSQSDGNAFISAAIEAIQYVVDNDIKLSNNSWGFAGSFSQALYDSIASLEAIGHLFVNAAGNSFGRDIDIAPFYPGSFDLSHMIVVAATGGDDILAFFSSIGPISVDLAAPGFDTLSTEPDVTYGFRTGTSMACAHVTGVAALLMGRRPDLNWQQVKSRLLDTTRPLASLSGRMVTGGVVNAVAAVGDCNLNAIPDELDIADLTSDDCNGNEIPDECETDCNNNDSADDCDLDSGTSSDCNGNAIPDECDIAAGVSVDCNANGVPDACDIADGTSQDLNASGVPDECETCSVDADCDDLSECTVDTCDAGLCFLTPLLGSCDDGDPCTGDDICIDGVCRGEVLPVVDCAPLLSLRAAAINSVPIAGGPTGAVTVDRGDQLTIELLVERWSPETIQGYTVVVGSDGYISGSTGRLWPIRDPTPDDGAFMDEDRADFLFHELTRITAVDNTDPADYLWGGIVLFPGDCPADNGETAYLGTLILDVSATAAGTFTICAEEDDSQSFLIDCPEIVVLSPIAFECLIVHVPVTDEDCSSGVDCNANGQWDICDIHNGTSSDCNRNDIPDECDLADGLSNDCNANAVPDECDLAADTSADCNNNDTPDECDIASGVSNNCNANAIPDECEPGANEDCNENGTPDLCDIHDGVATDCNLNFIPDRCDLDVGPSRDCNANELPDECDIAAGTSEDCDGDGVPNECEPDCNENGVPDECDVADGSSTDCADNGIPDECLGIFSGGLLGTYYQRRGFNGNSVSRVDPTINFHWGTGPPIAGIGPDRFSIRWIGWVNAPVDGTYTFYVKADDGVRLWVDGQFLIDEWERQDLTEWSAPIVLAGSVLYSIRLETRDESLEKTIVLSWSGPSMPKEVMAAGSLHYEVPDCNGNGIADECDLADGLGTDCNANGVLDVCDVVDGTSGDCNINGVPDECELAIPQDSCSQAQPVCPDIFYTGSTVGVLADGDAACGNSGDSPDVYYSYIPLTDGELTVSLCAGTDYDAVLSIHTGCPASADNQAACDDDHCGGAGPSEVTFPVIASVEYIIRVTGWGGSAGPFILDLVGPACAIGDGDCNDDGIPDICGLADGTDADCNGNGIPDECDPDTDCNGDGIPDICGLANGTDADCDGNGVPDECDPDEDSDGVPDACDLCPGADDLIDLDGDGVPDCVLAAVPTVSAWGVTILALLLLVAAKARLGRRRSAAV
ncbi:MAG: S8 family serine peptidase [Planctomycetes bacterium]|nr:S8 family serine peptidase [Planctomycetota bacterium]